jgi:hypothetical protein
VGVFVAVVGFVMTLVLAITVSTIVQRAWAKTGDGSALERARDLHQRDTQLLWWLVLLAVAYSLWLACLRQLTGIALLDGSIGVALGLYISAHPAANAVNLLFFERDTLNHLSEWSVLRWLGLNLLVLVAGWVVIFIGLRRLLDAPA